MTIDYTEWRAGDAARRASNEPFARGAETVKRMRSRTRDEAAFLRSIGTPERKIGPVQLDVQVPETT